MVAYDSRRMPDPDKLLSAETAEALLEAFCAQLGRGDEPVPALSKAVHRAAKEARERQLPPEALLIQLKELAERAGIPSAPGEDQTRRHVRAWMVTATLRAYWE